jgi:hypothetical protein
MATPGSHRSITTRFRALHGQHTGLQVLGRETYRRWTLIVEHRQLGVTVRRDQFSVRIEDEQDTGNEYLTGFASRATALQAARRRVDFIMDIQRPRMPQRNRRRQLLARYTQRRIRDL